MSWPLLSFPRPQAEPVPAYRVSPSTSPSTLSSATIAVHGEHETAAKLRCPLHPGPPPACGGTSHFWTAFSCHAWGQGSPEQDGGFSPKLAATQPAPSQRPGCRFIQCWLCRDMFWEPLNLSHEAICCTFPRKCILISKGKGRFIWKQPISWHAAAVCVKPAQSPWLDGPLTATGAPGLKKPMRPRRPCLCFVSLLYPTVWLIGVFCYLSSDKCLLACNRTRS